MLKELILTWNFTSSDVTFWPQGPEEEPTEPSGNAEVDLLQIVVFLDFVVGISTVGQVFLFSSKGAVQGNFLRCFSPKKKGW